MSIGNLASLDTSGYDPEIGSTGDISLSLPLTMKYTQKNIYCTGAYAQCRSGPFFSLFLLVLWLMFDFRT
jgi:hypothetical protein